ncbi:MAG: hypothetical protein JKY66_09925, partial [Spongiibacteraceae bacterium]|nr:hypothetical protein [Spongiibacteraceae bacterium]
HSFSFTSSKKTNITDLLTSPSQSNSATQGSAVITSQSNPAKTLSINSRHQQTNTEQDPKQNETLMQLLGNEKIQALLKDPNIQKLAMTQLNNDPQKLNELGEATGLSIEKLQELLKQLPQQQ